MFYRQSCPRPPSPRRRRRQVRACAAALVSRSGLPDRGRLDLSLRACLYWCSAHGAGAEPGAEAVAGVQPPYLGVFRPGAQCRGRGGPCQLTVYVVNDRCQAGTAPSTAAAPRDSALRPSADLPVGRHVHRRRLTGLLRHAPSPAPLTTETDRVTRRQTAPDRTPSRTDRVINRAGGHVEV